MRDLQSRIIVLLVKDYHNREDFRTTDEHGFFAQFHLCLSVVDNFGCGWRPPYA